MEDRNYRLIVAYFDKTIDDDGLAELKEWLESNSHHQEMFSETIQILSVSRNYYTPQDQSGSAWSRIQAHIAAENTAAQDSSSPNFNGLNRLSSATQEAVTVTEQIKNGSSGSKLKRWFIAAVFLLMTGAAALIGYQNRLMKVAVRPAYAQFSNPKGKHSIVILPDSTVIHLGAGSKIRYEKSFSSVKRLVELDGEAFFDVRHHPKRPFVVKSGQISTVVLGTSFNVKGFSTKNKVSVTVNTGKVGILSDLQGKSRLLGYLLPDEQLIINTSTGSFSSGKISAEAVSSWRDNNFVYYNTSLKEIAESLERHYNVNINFSNPELAKVKLTAKFNNLPLNEIADNLSQLSGLYFRRTGNQLTITDHYQKRRDRMK